MAVGSYIVRISNAKGLSNSVSFTVQANTPAITSIVPNPAKQGAVITINGLDFTATGNDLQVSNDGGKTFYSQGKINSNGTSITFTIPPAIAVWVGSHFLRVSNANGTSNSVPLTVNNPKVAPSNLVARMSTTIGKVNLSWTDNSTIESGFQIERAVDANSSSFSVIATSKANTVSYIDDLNTVTLPSNSEAYRVRAVFLTVHSPITVMWLR